jgi:alpha-ketoglutarate-dependent taurine dioxygenase
LRALDDAVRQAHAGVDMPVPSGCAAACAEAVAPVREALEKGRGFAILDRVPLDRYSAQEAQLIYWVLGRALGRPVAQNVQGELLYHVQDTGQDVRSGARFSVTNAESTFHTDGSFWAQVPDYVGLLCLKTARTGGLSQMVSGHAVLDELRRLHPDVLALLQEPYQIDRRGGRQEGEAPTVPFPVIEENGGGLTIRYLRYWIEIGQEKAGVPLTAKQVRALDVLDELLQSPDLRVEFALEPGQIYLINNRWILHNRTRFDDHAEPEKRRHLVRLWLARP